MVLLIGAKEKYSRIVIIFVRYKMGRSEMVDDYVNGFVNRLTSKFPIQKSYLKISS